MKETNVLIGEEGILLRRTILHVDMNNFYASVECLYHPELRDRPVAVCGNPQLRHGIVLAKNILAKASGIQTGDPIWLARQKCPGLVCVGPNYGRYLRYSHLAREIYGEYTDRVESFGLDECWLDLTGCTHLWGSGEQVANILRRRIRQELGVTASVGVSYNKVFAKLGSDYRKPDATTVITPENFHQLVWPLPAKDLLYVGQATCHRLDRYGVRTIGDLAQLPLEVLERSMGKNGRMLWKFANGLDHTPVAHSGEAFPIKSVGNSTTAPRDLVQEEEVKITLYLLAESVSSRLRGYGMTGETVCVYLRQADLSSCVRQCKLPRPTCNGEDLFRRAFALYQANCHGEPLRSLGLKVSGLHQGAIGQTSFLPEVLQQERTNVLETAVEQVRRRFGHRSLQRCIMLADPALSRCNPREEHVIHPVSFLHG